MASSLEAWMGEFNDASKLADKITAMISERGSMPASGPETQRFNSSLRRMITILSTRLDNLESTLSKFPKQPKSDKEFHKRQEAVANLRSRAKQMASTLSMSNFGNREDLLGPSRSPADEMKRTEGVDNYGIVGLQRQIMKEQDEGLGKLEDTVLSTKHIALAVNEELDLHTRLIDTLDQHVESTDSRLQEAQGQILGYAEMLQKHENPGLPRNENRIQKRLGFLNKQTRGGCSCINMLLAVIGIVILIVVVYLLIKYL